MSRRHDPSGTGSAVLWTVSGLLATALAWSCLGELEVVSTVRGRVVPEAQLQIVQSPIAGTVRSIHIVEGETVEAGQVLMVLDPSLLQADVDSTRAKLALLRAELVRLEAERAGVPLHQTVSGELMRQQTDIFLARKSTHDQRRREYRAILDSRRASLKGGEVLAKTLERRLTIAIEKEQRAKPYVDIAIPRFQYLQLQDEVAVVEKELASQRLNNQRLVSEVEEASQRLMQISSVRQYDIEAEFTTKQSALRQLEIDLAKAEIRLNEAVIRAPHDGTVQKVIPTTLGASFGAHQALVHLVPINSQLQLEIMIPNEEMGYMRLEQPVDVKFDAFPFQKYGRMTGALRWISPDAELVTSKSLPLLTQAATMRAAGAGEVSRYYYKGVVRLDPPPNDLLRAAVGMTAQADIRTDRRRIIDFLLFPMRQGLEEAARVR